MCMYIGNGNGNRNERNNIVYLVAYIKRRNGISGPDTTSCVFVFFVPTFTPPFPSDTINDTLRCIIILRRCLGGKLCEGTRWIPSIFTRNRNIVDMVAIQQRTVHHHHRRLLNTGARFLLLLCRRSRRWWYEGNKRIVVGMVRTVQGTTPTEMKPCIRNRQDKRTRSIPTSGDIYNNRTILITIITLRVLTTTRTTTEGMTRLDRGLDRSGIQGRIITHRL